MNVSHAIAELERARDELLRVESKPFLTHERRKQLVEPLSRLDLAKRFLAATLRKYGWQSTEGDL